MDQTLQSRNLDETIREGGYDFLDFGCSKGGSIRWAQRTLGGARGLGVDLDPRKVAQSLAAGIPAIQGDATALNCGKRVVSFVSMLHFIEHLPNAKVATQAIRSAARIARDFVYIRYPWFGADTQLFELGYKFYWSDWHGHRNHFTTLDLYKAIRRTATAREWFIFGRGRVRDTATVAIVPFDTPINSYGCGELPQDRPALPLHSVYGETACLIITGRPGCPNPLKTLLQDGHTIIQQGRTDLADRGHTQAISASAAGSPSRSPVL